MRFPECPKMRNAELMRLSFFFQSSRLQKKLPNAQECSPERGQNAVSDRISSLLRRRLNSEYRLSRKTSVILRGFAGLSSRANRNEKLTHVRGTFSFPSPLGASLVIARSPTATEAILMMCQLVKWGDAGCAAEQSSPLCYQGHRSVSVPGITSSAPHTRAREAQNARLFAVAFRSQGSGSGRCPTKAVMRT